MAVALGIHNQIILAKTIIASLLTLRVEYASRREEHPVDIILIHQCIEIEVAKRTHPPP